MVKLNVEQIMDLIPHRYPMLLVDKVDEIIPNEQINATKCVSINENFFSGHFPNHPVMPGVLIIEALAQAGAVLVSHSNGDLKGKIVYFMSIEKASFRSPVVPGDCLKLNVTKVQSRTSVWKMKGEASVDGKVVTEALFTAMIMDKK